MLLLDSGSTYNDSCTETAEIQNRAANPIERGQKAETTKLSEKDKDLALVERVRSGDRSAFDLLVLKYQHKTAKLISRYLKDKSEIEDVAQETFISAYRGLKNFRGDSAFSTWLYRIAVNTSYSYLSSRARKPTSDFVDISEANMVESIVALREDHDPYEDLLSDRISETVLKTFNSLPESLQMALSLREQDGLSYQEIADNLNCPIGTVRSRISRARGMIEMELRPLLG